MDAINISKVTLGKSVTLDDIVAVARYDAVVEFSNEYVDRVNKCRKLVDKFSDEGKAIYGITTGLGDNWSKFISKEDRDIIQRNHILSHATSVGEPIERECVRAIMFTMLTQLGTGYTGIRIETLEQIKNLLNNKITPFVPKHGSVGYIGLEAHIGLVLIGEGHAWYKDELLTGDEALKAVGLKPIELKSKEGLSLVSGTTSVTGITSLALYDAIIAARTADISGAMSLEVLKGTLMAMDERIMNVRPHIDQKNTASNIRRILEDSEIIETYKNYRVQDALSLRCMPQLHGAAKRVINDSIKTIETELNSAVDNPLIFSEEGDGVALMGCNADGAYAGIIADTIAIATTNLMKMSERRIDRLVNRHVSELPPFLNANPGLNNGLMIPQYSAAGLIGEMRLHCHPATIDNVTTCANQEDYVNMGYNAALQAYECISLSKYILAIELMFACQAQNFYKELKPSSATKEVCDLVRETVPFIEHDVNTYPYMEHIAGLVSNGEIIDVVENQIGKLDF